MHRILALAAFAALGACGPKPVICTDLAAVSITVTVIDDSGEPVFDAEVTYQPDGGDVTDCESWPGGAEATFACGYEVAGEITVRVSSPGFDPVERVVTVASDECHVIGEAVEITLTPADPV